MGWKDKGEKQRGPPGYFIQNPGTHEFLVTPLVINAALLSFRPTVTFVAATHHCTQYI